MTRTCCRKESLGEAERRLEGKCVKGRAQRIPGECGRVGRVDRKCGIGTGFETVVKKIEIFIDWDLCAGCHARDHFYVRERKRFESLDLNLAPGAKKCVYRVSRCLSGVMSDDDVGFGAAA